MLKLVNERDAHAAEIGQLKNDHGSEVFTPIREEEVLHHVIEANKGPLPADTVRAVFRDIITASPAPPKKLNVGHLGPQASFSHPAPVPAFSPSSSFPPVPHIP